MYIKELEIKNYRSIKDLKLTFNKGLNILIGENNSGKSAIIDALRICLSYGNQWREIYINRTDFFIDREDCDAGIEDIEFHLHFAIEQTAEIALFGDLYVAAENEHQLHFKYYIEEINGNERIRYKIWGGENEGQTIAPEMLDLIYFVYLDALRDAVEKLKPVRGNKVGELYSNLERDKDNRKAMSDKIHNLFSSDVEWTTLVKKGKDKINQHLKQTSITEKKQKIVVDFLPFEFTRIVDNLRIQIPIFDLSLSELDKQKYFQINQNGLGYNNLIYTATVLGHLNEQRVSNPSMFIALLLEEPEAHLHPQLQDIFFNYLSELNEVGFQTFVTSHSPTITSKANLDTITVLQTQNNKISSLPLNNSALTDDNKKYLHKFLDVTKSQLFFANGVLLVEGISEALLLPVFSEMIGTDKEYSIDKNGIELVNINGIAFEHFAKLFNDNPRLNTRCSILTDNDRDLLPKNAFKDIDGFDKKKSHAIWNELQFNDFIDNQGRITPKFTSSVTIAELNLTTPYSSKHTEIVAKILEFKCFSARAQNAESLEANNLKVKLADITFEYELIRKSKRNAAIARVAFSKLHPVAAKNIQGATLDEFAISFVDKLISNKAKSKFAHELSIILENNNVYRKYFEVPEYIHSSIKWVVKGV